MRLANRLSLLGEEWRLGPLSDLKGDCDGAPRIGNVGWERLLTVIECAATKDEGEYREL